MTKLGKKLAEFYQSFGKAKKMVLSTSSEGKVSSRMMSVVLIDGKPYTEVFDIEKGGYSLTEYKV